MPSRTGNLTFECMTRLHARHRLSALPTIVLLVLTSSCGSGDDDGAAASVDDDRETAIDAPDADSSAPEADSVAAAEPDSAEPPVTGPNTPPASGPDDGTAAGAGCVLDEAAVSEAIGVEVIAIGDCDFAAGAAAGEAVTWSVELYVDPTIPEALEGGTPIEQLGDRATWNDGLGVLSVQAGERHFQIQPLRLGDPPITLGSQELAEAVARLVLERS